MPDFSLRPAVDNYAVVGKPVAHSKSPQIHTAFARQTQQDLYYQAIEVDAGQFTDTLSEFQKRGGKGLNVTVPYKGDAWSASDHLTERARRSQAVNTLRFGDDNYRYGDTTDGIGLVRDLEVNHGINLNGFKILILGAGGAIRGVLDPLFDAGTESVVIANRTVERARDLVVAFSDRGKISACGYADLPSTRFNLIINGTSASLQGEVPPVPESVFESDPVCYDLMYADEDTPFMQWIRARGVSKIYDGLGMLVEQAAASFEIWRGVRPETRQVIEILRKGSQ